MTKSLTWVKSSYSGSQGGNCLEVAADAHGEEVLVRDTKDREGPVLEFRAAQWRRFAAKVKAGHSGVLGISRLRFPLPPGTSCIQRTSPFFLSVTGPRRGRRRNCLRSLVSLGSPIRVNHPIVLSLDFSGAITPIAPALSRNSLLLRARSLARRA